MQKENNRVPIWIFFAVAALGIWLLAAPHTFGFQNGSLIYSNWICGILFIFLGCKGRKTRSASSLWSIAIIGIWLQLSPLLFWAKEPAAYLNDTLVGSLALLLALVLHPIPGMLPDIEPSVPPGWSYNPSAWPTRIWIAFLAFICWMISRYLAAYQLGYVETIWDPFFSPGTKAVLESSVSKAFPVSDAGLGALAYTCEFFAACIGGKNRWRTAPWAVLIFGILVIPVSLVSVLLIILQPLSVGTWCALCLCTASCMLIGIPFAIAEVAATLEYLRDSREKSMLSLVFKGGLCPGASVEKNPAPIDGSLGSLWKAACTGISASWHHFATIAVGVSLMAAPSLFDLPKAVRDADPIAGALAIVVAVISMSEKMGFIRFVNGIFGVWTLVQLFWLDGTPLAYGYHGVAAILLIVFSKRRKYS
jgi:hypothetical protein